MTVAELIEKLKLQPQDRKVIYHFPYKNILYLEVVEVQSCIMFKGDIGERDTSNIETDNFVQLY